MRVLVTGGSGLIGRHIVESLIADPTLEVFCTRNSRSLLPTWQGRVNEAEAHGGPAALAAAVLAANPTAIIHSAAALPGNIELAPDNLYRANRDLDAAVADAARDLGARVIYLSTCALATFDPAKATLSAIDAYLQAKRAGEDQFLSLDNAIVLRVAAPLAPELPPWSIARRFMAAARDNGIIDVWGTGTREQNFVDCRDIARLTATCLSSTIGGRFTAAGNEPVSMLRLAEEIISLLGYGKIVLGGTDPQEGERCQHSNAETRTAFAWAPHHSLGDSLRWIADAKS